MKIFQLSLSFCLFALGASPALAHSGGTDANGCHAGSQPYHCHNGGGSYSPPPAAAPRSGSGCHPSYAGICIPANASDVDCAGGSGNGPVYARGPFQVVGPDVYGLDRDRDGWGCE
ncbi:YHYH domain-containing protein [Mameliella alba]|uniref:YHYH domain-containing protein n=1 Tax=Mameliella alba TaxID=561184 RepID=UPI000B530457|nr:hypothetical protein CDZ95_20495 [Mameliella alba]